MATRERRAGAAGLLVLLGALTAGCASNEASPNGEPAGGGLRGRGLSGDLRIAVAPGLAPVAERQAAAFMRRYPHARLTLVPATAREGVAALARGDAGAALLDRPLNDEERRVFAANGAPVREVLVGTDAVALVVPAGNPVRALDPAALRLLLAGEPVGWTALADSTAGPPPRGRAELALAPLNTGAVEVLATALLPARARPRPAHPERDEAAVLDRVARTPNALGAVPMAALRADTTGRLRALALPDAAGRPTPPSQRAVADAHYPLLQPVHLVVGAGGPLASAFATFARGVQGQEAVLRAGLAPAVMPAREILLRPDPPGSEPE